jgi:hypothetical protein
MSAIWNTLGIYEDAVLVGQREPGMFDEVESVAVEEPIVRVKTKKQVPLKPVVVREEEPGMFDEMED